MLLTALVYIPTLRYGFVYDDSWVLVTNGFLREPELHLLLSPEGVARHVPDVFRPTSVLFDLLSVRLVGMNSVGQHALGVGLHLACVALLFAWLRRMRASLALAGSSALLFGVLAIHAETVAVVSYREDSLALALALTAAWCASTALRRAPGSARRLATFSALAMAAAAGAKLSVAPFPFVWWVVERASPFDGRSALRSGRRIGFAFWMLVGVAAALAIRVHVLGGLDPYATAHNPRVLANREGVEFGGIMAASLQIQLAYLVQMIWPRHLSPEYVDQVASWRDPATLVAIVAALGVTALTIATWWRARTDGHRSMRLVWAALAATLLLLLPTANFVGMPNMRADRFAYASSLPFSILLAAFMLRVGERWADAARPERVLIPLVAFALLQGSFAVAASAAYASNNTLWAAALRRAPASSRAHAMVGLTRLSRVGARVADDPELAARIRRDCDRAEALDPLDEHAQICHARLDVAVGEYEAAKSRFARTLELGPDHHAAALSSLAELELTAEILSEADWMASERWLDRAKAEYPFSPQVWVTAGRAARRRGEPERARIDYARARSLRPERWDTVAAALELELDLGHIPRAYAIWHRAAKYLGDADPIRRDYLRARLYDALRLRLQPSLALPALTLTTLESTRHAP